MTLTELNGLDRDRFVATIGWIFEHSPWVAERAWHARPFPSSAALLAAMVAEVQRATDAEQLALIRAHPDLGTRARMSAASVHEQSGAGLDSLNAAEYSRLLGLNETYKSRFGFPFIHAVKGSTKQEIMAGLEGRIESVPAVERATALAHIGRIARFRLEDTISE